MRLVFCKCSTGKDAAIGRWIEELRECNVIVEGVGSTAELEAEAAADDCGGFVTFVAGCRSPAPPVVVFRCRRQ